MYTKEDIIGLLETRDEMVRRSLVQLYNKQTLSEQNIEETTERNGIGFNGTDGNFGTSLAKQVLNGSNLSPKQIISARKMLIKYAGQLTKIANANIKPEPEEKPLMVIEDSDDGTLAMCPACRQGYPIKGKAYRDRDNDITHWDGKCSNCGAVITIIND